jgi:hypothetical protein
MIGRVNRLRPPAGSLYVGVMGSSDPTPTTPAPSTSQLCAELSGKLHEAGYDALPKAMVGLEHNNAVYLEEYRDLTPEWRNGLNICAQHFGGQKVKEAWDAYTPAQKTEHLEYVQKELDKATKGKPGVSFLCPPGMPPAACKQALEEEIDRATCKGISVPLGPAGLNACVPRWLIVGGAAVVGLLIYNAVRR